MQAQEKEDRGALKKEKERNAIPRHTKPQKENGWHGKGRREKACEDSKSTQLNRQSDGVSLTQKLSKT